MTEDRWDLAIKVRFLRHLVHGHNPDAERLYRWHIEQRTGGVERRSWKRSVDDYVRACRPLVSTMRRRYDANYPVILGSNGRLMDGAHRIACALMLDLPIVAVHQRSDKPGNAAPWGEAWFRRNGMSEADLARVKLDWELIAP